MRLSEVSPAKKGLTIPFSDGGLQSEGLVSSVTDSLSQKARGFQHFCAGWGIFK